MLHSNPAYFTSDVQPPAQFRDIASVGVMISQAWPESRREHGATLAAIREVLTAYPWCEFVQTVDIPFPDERRAVADLTRAQGRPHTYTLTRIFAERRLNLSAIDADLRQASAREVIARLPEAAEAGGSVVCVVSGSCPTDTARRADALAALETSLAEICEAAQRRGDAEVMIEPLDYRAHKCATLGTVAEGASLVERLRARGLPLRLCVDTAHMLLNGEEVVAAVQLACDALLEFHFCNPVLTAGHALFGDRHLPFGAPGAVDVPQLAHWMAALYRGGFLSPTRRPRLCCEVMKPDALSSIAVVTHGLHALDCAWSIARRELATP